MSTTADQIMATDDSDPLGHLASETSTPRLEQAEATVTPKLSNHRTSLRQRPSQLFEQNARPASPLKSGPDPALRQRSSKMSLFNLFSRPKVEKARGHTEPGLAVDRMPARSPVLSQPSPTQPAPSRRTSLATKKPSQLARKPTLSLPPRNSARWTPPPLFQAYPQAIKHGVHEVAPLTTDLTLQLAKSRKALALRASSPEHDVTATSKRHSSSKAMQPMLLPTKIFILVTSGYLLVYSATGQSDRLPERVLRLGQESATFASDMIPGRVHVLQISQAAEKRNVTSDNSGSFLSRLAARGSASRRDVQNLLLVLASPLEMDAWLCAIRKEIQTLGESEAELEKDVHAQRNHSETQQIDNGLYQTPSTSHRYRVKRDPNKVDVIGPVDAETTDHVQSNEPEAIPDPVRPDDMSETATLDGIELEAAQLEHRAEFVANPEHGSPDPDVVPAIQEARDSKTSLSKISSSIENITDSEVLKIGENMIPVVPFRSRNSRAIKRNSGVFAPPPAPPPFPPPRRRSGNRRSFAGNGTMALATEVVADKKISIIADPAVVQAATFDPLTERSSPSSDTSKRESKSSSPPKEVIQKHDPDMLPLRLATTRVISSNPVKTKRASILPFRTSPIQTTPPSDLSNTQVTARNRESVRSFRQSMHGFSLPLKINPSSPSGATSPSQTDPKETRVRTSTIMAPTERPGPMVHTLMAKVDTSTRRVSSQPNLSTCSALYDMTQRQPARHRSVNRGNAFAAASADMLASTAIPNSNDLDAHPMPAMSPAASNTSPPVALRRPNSIQIRSSHAPFLQNFRDSQLRTTSNPARSRNSIPPEAIPPRDVSLPRANTHNASISTTNSAKTLVSPSGSPDSPPRYLAHDSKSSSVTLVETIPENEEGTDEPRPLPQEQVLLSAVACTALRHASSKRLRPRSNLPDLTIGVALHSLEPPTPPPQAPLPPTPPMMRSISPSPLRMHPPAKQMGVTV